MFVVSRKVECFLYVPSKYTGLENGLSIVLGNPFGRPVCGEDKQRGFAKECFGHSGRTRGFSAEWIVWPGLREAVVLLASNQAAPVGKIRRALLDQTWSGTVQEVIYTRGEFRGSFTEDGGRRVYARLKLAPGRQVPFSTLTYRLRDAKLLEGLQPGAQVDFRAERIAGENTITEMRLPP